MGQPQQRQQRAERQQCRGNASLEPPTAESAPHLIADDQHANAGQAEVEGHAVATHPAVAFALRAKERAVQHQKHAHGDTQRRQRTLPAVGRGAKRSQPPRAKKPTHGLQHGGRQQQSAEQDVRQIESGDAADRCAALEEGVAVGHQSQPDRQAVRDHGGHKRQQASQ